jgi:hypothetical protein
MALVDGREVGARSGTALPRGLLEKPGGGAFYSR